MTVYESLEIMLLFGSFLVGTLFLTVAIIVALLSRKKPKK